MKLYLKYILSLILERKKQLVLLFLLIIANTILGLAQPYIYKLTVDTLTNGLVAGSFTMQTINYLIAIVTIWFFVSVINNVTQAQTSFYGWQIANYCGRKVHLDGYRRLLKMDYHEHTKRHSTRHTKIVDDADSSTWEMTNWWLNRILPSTLGFFGMLIIAFSVSWQMTLLSLAVIPFGLALVIFMIKKYEHEQHQINKLWQKMYEHMSDQVSNIITYKLNQDEKLFMDVQKEYSDKAFNAQSRINKKWRMTSMLNPDVLARFGVMALGIFLVQNKSITLGTLFMFMGLLNNILSPLHLLADILPQYSRRAKYIERFIKLIEQKDFVTDPENPVHMNDINGEIEFRKVTYIYPGSGEKAFSIRDMSFHINPGEQVAIVGHSGAGKTTIVSLLTRLIDVTEGEILVDHVNVKNFNQEEFRKRIGVVLQENAMYDETVAQNIAYGKPNATKDEIILAAKRAQAHDFIQDLPDKYDTVIGEKGVRLSGGEKQRIAIARAILKDPKIVILDEPTSALDSITESKVQKGLTELMEGRTSIIIAHRLATVRNADKILLFEKGCLKIEGTHRELLQKSEDYKEMVTLQTGGFLAEEETTAVVKKS